MQKNVILITEDISDNGRDINKESSSSCQTLRVINLSLVVSTPPHYNFKCQVGKLHIIFRCCNIRVQPSPLLCKYLIIGTICNYVGVETGAIPIIKQLNCCQI